MEFHLAIPQDNAYARTHPLTGQRISVLESMYQKDPAWDTPTDPALEARFQRIKAKLAGYVLDPKQTLIHYPESYQRIPSRYARYYAWHKHAYPVKAEPEIDSLPPDNPADTHFLELKDHNL